VESLLTNLADELLVQDITEPSAVLGPLSDDELEAAYDFVLEHFALELLIGADKNSDWSNGKLVIDANHGPIHLLQAAFYAVRLEAQRRGVVMCCLRGHCPRFPECRCWWPKPFLPELPHPPSDQAPLEKRKYHHSQQKPSAS
jgi:hypothetical protein